MHGSVNVKVLAIVISASEMTIWSGCYIQATSAVTHPFIHSFRNF